MLAKNLMTLNSDVLQGGVRPIKQKIFKDTDRDRSGNSLAGARLVQLEGTDEFTASLARVPWNHRFKLGISTVTIRSVGRFPPGPNSRGRGRGGARGAGAGGRFPALGWTGRRAGRSSRGGAGSGLERRPGPSNSNNNNNNNINTDRRQEEMDIDNAPVVAGPADTSDTAVHALRHIAAEDLSNINLADEAKRTLLNASSGNLVTEIADQIRGNGMGLEGEGGANNAGSVPGAQNAPVPDH